MKITDPRVIEKSEHDLIQAVQEKLDPDTIKQILSDHLDRITFSSKGGQIVIHDHQIAFRLDFDLQLSGSLLFDRQGNYFSGAGDAAGPAPETEFAPALCTSSSDDPFDTPGYGTADPDLAFPSVPEDENTLARLPVDTLDDELHDILKESRQFRNQKKGV
ncbi:MAG: hypothetical protein ACNA7H_05735 [Desulfotignum sp.]